MLKYIGKTKWLPGVPARDLTDAEVELYGGKELLLKVGIYAEEPAQQPEKRRYSKDEEPVETGQEDAE